MSATNIYFFPFQSLCLLSIFLPYFSCLLVRAMSFPDPRTHAFSLLFISYSIIPLFDNLSVDALFQGEEVLSLVRVFNQEWALNFVKSFF